MRKFSILVLTALFLTGAAMVAEEPAPKPDKKNDSEEEVITFTTEDLERKYGPSVKTPPKPAAAKPAGPSDPKVLTPLEQMQAAQQANRDKAARREQLRKDVQASQARIKELEQRVAQLRNPLLGAAKPEEGEKASWDKADQAGRVKIAQHALAAERAKLQQTLKEIGELR